MVKFHTVKEAAILTGRSPSAIRRIIYPILEKNNHVDRHHIQPDVKTAKEHRIKGENFPWKISEELLRRESPSEPKQSSDSKSSGHRHDQSPAIIEILRKELDIKNRQIETQNDLLKGLSERLREGNILIGSLQQQLALGDGSSRPKSDVVDANVPTPSPASEKGIDTMPEQDQKTHWLFRKLF